MHSNLQRFTEQLLQWYVPGSRPMPWKQERDPYLIWLSEIILQQTRVEQGTPYFDRFKKAFPTVADLANAPEDQVMKLWQGLGYYSRARNLHAAAKYITNDLGGKFPASYDNLLNIKGVGPYTAAAIASFAYNLPHAVVDGNVYRVLSRYLGIETPTDSTDGKKLFHQLAHEALPSGRSADFNQAIMDFGATVCKPALPNCSTCPMQQDCYALRHNLVSTLPIKQGKVKVKERYFNYLVIKYQGDIYLKKRTEKDIWRNLYDMPLIESDKLLSKNSIKQHEYWQQHIAPLKPSNITALGPFTQKLTHRKINARFFELEVQLKPDHERLGWVRVQHENLSTFAFPKIVDCYFKDNTLYLDLS